MRNKDIKFSVYFLKQEYLSKSVAWVLSLIEACRKRETKSAKLLDNKFNKCKMYVIGTYKNKVYNAILFVKINSLTYNELENSGRKLDINI